MSKKRKRLRTELSIRIYNITNLLGFLYSIVKDSSADLRVNYKIVQIRPTVKTLSAPKFKKKVFA